MSDKPGDGLTPAEFARREGVSRTLVVRKMKSGHLPKLPGGRVSASLVGTAWRASAPLAQGRFRVSKRRNVPVGLFRCATVKITSTGAFFLPFCRSFAMWEPLPQ